MTNSPIRYLDQVHDLAANYSDRQGLRIVPMALIILIQSFPPVAKARFLGLELLPFLLALGIASYFMIGRAYEKRFGRIEQTAGPSMSVGLQIVVFLPLLLVATSLDITRNPPAFLSGLLLSVWIAANAWPARTVRRNYLVFCFFLALLCFLPMADVPRETVAQDFGIFFGAFFLVAGLSDHFYLVKLLSVPGERDEQTAI
jgi:hypothetical protein